MFRKELISLDVDVKTRDEAIAYLAELFEKNDCLKKETHAKDQFVKAIHEREETGSTALGLEFAIPHGRCEQVIAPCVAFAHLKESIKWDEDEDEDVRFILLVGIPATNEGSNNHLKILAKLSGAIMEDSFREEIMQACTDAEVLAILNHYTGSLK